MRAAANNSNRDTKWSCGIRQERINIQNTLQVKEITRKSRRPQRPDKFPSVGLASCTSFTHSPMPYKSKGRRKKQKPYITTKATTKQECRHTVPDQELMRCRETKVTVTVRQEKDRGSISNSSSTPRVIIYNEPRENHRSPSEDDTAPANRQFNDMYNDYIPQRTSELRHEDPPLPDILHEVNSTDGPGPIRQHFEIVKHPGQAIGDSFWNRSPSAPALPSSRSQLQFHENGGQNSNPYHVHCKVFSTESEPSTVYRQNSKKAAACDDPSLSESNRALSRYAEMNDSVTTVDSPNAQKHLQSSPPRHVQDASSLFEASILYGQWQNISRMRSHVASLRFSLQNKRHGLRMLQNEKSLADEAYFKKIKMKEFQMPFPSEWWSEKTTEELLCDCQKARDKYGSLEDEYNYIERDLDLQEYELSRHEEYFYSQLRDPSRYLPASTDHMRYPEWMEGPDHLEPQKPQELHPLVDAYFSKLGELDNFRELYDDILDEKLSLEEKVDLRKRFDMEPLTIENQEWLDSSQAQLDDLISKIKIAEEEEKELHQKCFSLGLIDEAGEPVESSKQEQSRPSLDLTLKSLEIPNQNPQFSPVFPSESSELESVIKILDSEKNLLTRNERFDRWSLEKLQISLHEVNIYTHCSKSYDELQDLSKLKKKFCEEDFTTAWFEDGFTDHDTKSNVLTATHSTPQ
ncbi:hypothetical protein BELL_0413g00030 [Botrytis elliptica]|uniref:Uncharacterized protein n=1 Tax=Botrytis elliptica TaxID=278938 RepID=A0A4Z1JNP0_9HELO|nr:hypothetical protein EAE99_009704 [Botrytis elliptica]TGO72842.1 hypothetical protein BELL_0413g00030 [Botrytis elliptica]